MTDEADDYPECGCQMDDCLICNTSCHYCGGEGWGIRGHDWPNDDPINDPDGETERCPCCHGSGQAKDCTFW